MRFACPHCDAHLQADATLAGKTIKCPACAQKLTIPEGIEEEEERPVEGAASGGAEETGVGSGLDAFATQKWTDYANVPMWQSLSIGAGLAVVWYGIMLAIPDSYLGQLFLERSWVQYFTTFLTTWSVGILVLKSLKLRKQQAAMLLEILPHDIGDEITPENTPVFHERVTNLPERVKDSFLVNRVRRGLEYFYVRRNNPEVASMMSSQSDIDANAIASSYTIIKVFIWAIPIMGFIGTVLGIGGAIGSFAGALAGADDPAMLIDSLKNVTSGLGTAFDTTLLALVLSLLVSFPASAIQKSEEDLLNQVDDYCNENLLKRLNDGGAGVGGKDADSGTLVARLGDAIARNQSDMIAKFEAMYANNTEAQQEQIAAFKGASEALGTQLEELENRAKQNQMLVDEQFTAMMGKVQGDATKTIGSLAEGINGLNKVLGELGEKQITIEKKGWFFRK
ncbi:MAG: MotA/TolQ/ExbB proton channel family protein [Verrucomicrobiota bacterium]